MSDEVKAADAAGPEIIITDAVHEAATDKEPESKPKRVPRGQVRITYRGPADVVSHGEFTFRPGQPVDVPSEVAEDLLTLPFEEFEVGDKE